ncbi:DNA translocase FtsK [Treponema sp. OMZ 840]|uniref:DNA translocase FtsK n=1 Tax=Treponema sp. OMZ 840 TaxID=244313 RepID=UPI003D8F922E
MKRSERGFMAAGIIVLAVSALCTVSLILQFLDFGFTDPIKAVFLYRFGRMLFSVYGFSSFLIPLYVFIAGLMLFSSQWSAKKVLYLLFSVVPFFTVAAVEFFVKKIFTAPTFTIGIIRITTFVLVSVLLCLIEYIAIGLIGDFFISTVRNKKQRKNDKKPKNKAESVLSASAAPTENKHDAVSQNLDEPEPAVFFADFDEIPDADSVDEEVESENRPPFFSQAMIKEADSEHIEAEYVPDEDYEEIDGFEEYDDFEIEEAAENGEHTSITEVPSGELFENPDEAEFLNNPFEFEVVDTNESSEFTEAVKAAEEKNTAAHRIPSVPKRQRGKPYTVPTSGLLTEYPGGEYWLIDGETRRSADALKETLNEFKIEAEVTGIRKGPVVTMFEILPAPGVKLSKIVTLGDNIALRLAASSVRIVAPIPGKHAVGIEVPNKERSIVSFKELIDTDIPAFKKMAIPVVLGKDIAGDAQVLDLAKTPHLLIAGATGSGKSVCVNSLILSILYKRSPQDVRMILIDPKIVELKLYNDIPHLLTPVITEPKKAFQALQYCLCEMERRYALLDGMGVRDIASYNKRIIERKIATEKLPYIVLIVDEFADLMATTGKELESTVARLAAMSRAVGIHLVLATQRPSIDVITGLIKANIPSRIAFMVASKMDSRIIIDQVGAEKLLGKGDMLYAGAVDPFPIRIQGTFVSDTEVENVVEYVKQYGEPDYIDDEIFVDDEEENFDPGVFSEGEDPLYDKALEIVMQAGKASASYIQRRLKIGYNRAARLVEDMEARGIVGPANGSKPREVIHVV